MNVSGATVLQVRVSLAMVGRCTVGVGGVVCRVTMSGQVQDTLEGFTRAGSQQEGRKGEKKDDNPLEH